MRKFTLITITVFTAFTSYSQSVQEKVDKLAKDPKTAENAAKADVYVSKNKAIFDSTSTFQHANAAKVKKDRKKKHCRKKS